MARLLSLVFLVATVASTGACASVSVEEEDGVDESGDAYSVATMSTEVNRRVATCFARSWATVTVREETDERYSSNVVVNGIGQAAIQMFTGPGWLVMLGSEGERELRQLEAEVRKTSEEQSLEDHQRVALVTCISSRLIDYAFNGLSKYLGASAAVGQREGVCTEYAAITSRLLRAASVPAGMRAGFFRDAARGTSGGHAWNWVTLESQGGETFWIEPQRDPIRHRTLFFNRQSGVARGGVADVSPAPCSGEDEVCVADAATCSALAGTTTGETCDVAGRSACCRASGTKRPSGERCAADGDCLSGMCRGRRCTTACDSGGASLCTREAGCAAIGGQLGDASCAGSPEGAACCSVTGDR